MVGLVKTYNLRMELSLGQSGILNIGTANFGSKYGVASISEGLNTKDLKEIFKILNQNPKIGIDTAPSYTKSEEIIGKYLNVETYKINTKIDSDSYSHPDLMVKSVKNSLLKTKQAKFKIVYLHGGRLNDFALKNSISEGLLRIKELELCEVVGVSCYTEDEILQSMENYPIVQAFQVPENILDQRLIHSTEVLRLSREGIKFEIRSIFLQGSILVKTVELPGYINKYKFYYENLISTACDLNTTIFDLALNYAISIPWKSSIVVGINDFAQFDKVVNFRHSQIKFEKISDLKSPQDLSDPRNWIKK